MRIVLTGIVEGFCRGGNRIGGSVVFVEIVFLVVIWRLYAYFRFPSYATSYASPHATIGAEAVEISGSSFYAIFMRIGLSAKKNYMGNNIGCPKREFLCLIKTLPSHIWIHYNKTNNFRRLLYEAKERNFWTPDTWINHYSEIWL